jgi:hypothetical protein
MRPVQVHHVFLSLRVVSPTKIDTLEEQQTEKIETEVKDVDRIQKHTGVHNTVQGVLLGHPLHTLLYTIPPLPTAPPPQKKRELPNGEFTVSVRIKSALRFTTRVV